MPGDVIVLSDCRPQLQERYDAFGPVAGKFETRGAHPETTGVFLRFTRRRIGIWSLFYGHEHKEERLQAAHVSGRLREAHPDLSALLIIARAWGEMAYRYIDAAKEWARKMVRLLTETVRRGEFRRKALTPAADGCSRLWYPTTFLMERPADTGNRLNRAG